VSLIGWMALSFGGGKGMFRPLGIDGVLLPLLCLPLFVLFVFRPKWGFYVFLFYGLAFWGIPLLLWKRGFLDDMATGSDMDRWVLLCVCSIGLSYGFQKMSEGRQRQVLAG
jgi:hypothetical protein